MGCKECGGSAIRLHPRQRTKGKGSAARIVVTGLRAKIAKTKPSARMVVSKSSAKSAKTVPSPRSVGCLPLREKCGASARPAPPVPSLCTSVEGELLIAGDEVRIEGLRTSPAYNGLCGSVQSVGEGGRYIIWFY